MRTVKHTNTYQRVLDYIGPILSSEVHIKRIQSLSTAVYGMIQAGSIAISCIGKALGLFRGLNPKHAIKQVDRMISNPGIDLNIIFPKLVSYAIGPRKNIVVAFDWTDFTKDNQATLAIHLVNKSGRASPLIWKTVDKSNLKNNRNNIEDELVKELKSMIPEDVHVTLLADRGFVDQAFFNFLLELNFDFVIRGKSNILVTHGKTTNLAKDWVHATGKARLLTEVFITKNNYYLPSFVTVRDKKMKESWLLLSSLETHRASEIVKLYSRRFTIEESFRDIKDLRFGVGLSSIRVNNPLRRDRMLLICALAIPFLTLLGAAGESLGMDRMLKANTVKRRTHSLFTQGCYYFAAIPNMEQDTLEKLVKKFTELIIEHQNLTEALGWI